MKVKKCNGKISRRRIVSGRGKLSTSTSFPKRTNLKGDLDASIISVEPHMTPTGGIENYKLRR
jgi:hypothetical protein